jgi:AcrR family transcriptional regulator
VEAEYPHVSVPQGKERRSELVQIAYRHLIEKGFEGLRVRDIAQEAGINNATLHYYYPTKEFLIQAVVAHLMQEFSTNRLPSTNADRRSALNDLRREFEDLRQRFQTMPEMFMVLIELVARSRRDPTIAHILRYLDEGWRNHLVQILERGVRDGIFRPDIDVVRTATILMVQFKGVGYELINRDPAEIDDILSDLIRQIEHWLLIS